MAHKCSNGRKKTKHKSLSRYSLSLLCHCYLSFSPSLLFFGTTTSPAPLHKQQITHPQKAAKIKSPSFVAELHGICLLGEIRRRYGFQKLETKKSKWLWGWIGISPKENVMWKLSSSQALPSAQIMVYFRCFTFGQIVCGVNGLDSSLDFRPSATIIGICC